MYVYTDMIIHVCIQSYQYLIVMLTTIIPCGNKLVRTLVFRTDSCSSNFRNISPLIGLFNPIHHLASIKKKDCNYMDWSKKLDVKAIGFTICF